MTTRVLRIDTINPEIERIAEAAKILRQGALVAFPTETVYGLGANFLDKKAVDRVYEVKQRPREKPLAIHIVNRDCVRDFARDIPEIFYKLSDRFWPGPLTLILKGKTEAKIGFRMPANKIARELIAQSRVPVVLPSANLSGEAPPTNAKGVLKAFNGIIELIVDGGNTDIGIASTVLDLTLSPPKVLREGAIKSRELF